MVKHKMVINPGSRLAGTLAAGQIQGDRECQEDSYGIFEVEAASPEKAGHALLVLADGMGGHAGGSRASQIVTQAFGEIYQKTNGSVGARLRSSLDGTNQAIADEVGEHPEYSGMGSTLVAVVVTAQGFQWLSVGDSLLWKLDASGNLHRLNADHSMAPVLQELVASGRMTAEEAKTDKRRHALRSALNGEELRLVDLATKPVILVSGERLLIASDGITTLSTDEIADGIRPAAGVSIEKQLSELLLRVEQAQKAGQDNTTIMLFAADRDH